MFTRCCVHAAGGTPQLNLLERMQLTWRARLDLSSKVWRAGSNRPQAPIRLQLGSRGHGIEHRSGLNGRTLVRPAISSDSASGEERGSPMGAAARVCLTVGCGVQRCSALT